MQVQISLQSEVTASALVQDIQKYAGLDYAAIYSKNLNELRKFITVNIYFGPVSDTPTQYSSNKKLNWIQERFSLTFGLSVGDLSSNENSDIEGDNAYIYGIGFRLNKYFRINAGNMLYRSKTSGGMEDDFSVGASIDLTAFDALKGLVSK